MLHKFFKHLSTHFLRPVKDRDYLREIIVLRLTKARSRGLVSPVENSVEIKSNCFVPTLRL